MSKQSLLEEFEWRCITISSFLERDSLKQFLSKAIDQTREETIESIVKYIRENLTAEESWERGDIYININNVETLGSGSFNWDNEFWDELKNNLLNNLN